MKTAIPYKPIARIHMTDWRHQTLDERDRIVQRWTTACLYALGGVCAGVTVWAFVTVGGM